MSAASITVMELATWSDGRGDAGGGDHHIFRRHREIIVALRRSGSGQGRERGAG